MAARQPLRDHNQRYQISLAPSEYVRRNIYITTAGVCSDPALRCSLDTLGTDKVMFSIDYPFEDTGIASRWIDNAALSDEERALPTAMPPSC